VTGLHTGDEVELIKKLLEKEIDSSFLNKILGQAFYLNINFLLKEFAD